MSKNITASTSELSTSVFNKNHATIAADLLKRVECFLGESFEVSSYMASSEYGNVEELELTKGNDRVRIRYSRSR